MRMRRAYLNPLCALFSTLKCACSFHRSPRLRIMLYTLYMFTLCTGIPPHLNSRVGKHFRSTVGCSVGPSVGWFGRSVLAMMWCRCGQMKILTVQRARARAHCKRFRKRRWPFCLCFSLLCCVCDVFVLFDPLFISFHRTAAASSSSRPRPR